MVGGERSIVLATTGNQRIGHCPKSCVFSDGEINGTEHVHLTNDN